MNKKDWKPVLGFFGICFVVAAICVALKTGIREVGHYDGFGLEWVSTGHRFILKRVDFAKTIPLLIAGIICFIASATINQNDTNRSADTASAGQSARSENSGECKPISMWGYFGYEILFSLPFIGWIILIVNAVSAKNVNLRNFARSYFCFLIVLAAIFVMSSAMSFSFLQDLF